MRVYLQEQLRLSAQWEVHAQQPCPFLDQADLELLMADYDPDDKMRSNKKMKKQKHASKYIQQKQGKATREEMGKTGRGREKKAEEKEGMMKSVKQMKQQP